MGLVRETNTIGDVSTPEVGLIHRECKCGRRYSRINIGGYEFSTGYTSVHGERPSAEYAKLRKESLESKFGHALGTYSSTNLSAYYRFGPFLAIYRAAIISFQVAKLTVWHFYLQDINKRAAKVAINLMVNQVLEVSSESKVNKMARLFSDFVDGCLSVPINVPGFTYHTAIKAGQT
ncbi:hypothetical protein GIB67_035419 [Kingdonia uniflora]|uniref:Uncharacterized protein n=1 Tax=Kingdonia uniflora TaxID=39325 RepID=A0A7J7P0A0_9MAGN|nr:hypothetical protein GIB67_035419 [Kingdonia uniflora]